MARGQGYESPLLARYKPLIQKSTTTECRALEIRLDSICSRSCITRWTLAEHFPTLLNKTFPNRPPSRSMFKGSPPIKDYGCVRIFLELQDIEGEMVGIEVQFRICEDLEGNKVLDGKIMLGKDFWDRADVVVSWPEVKKRKKAGWVSWKAKEADGVLGMTIGEQRVNVQKPVQVKC